MFKISQSVCIASLIILSVFSDYARSSLLSAPTSMTEEEVEKKALALPLGMEWQSTAEANCPPCSLGFSLEAGNTIIRIRLENNFPLELSKFENTFIRSEHERKTVWTYILPILMVDNFIISEETPDSLEEVMGIVNLPRCLQNQSPRVAEIIELAQIVAGKHCVFYTGAGISADVVPTMNILMGNLGLIEMDKKDKFIRTIHDVLSNPDYYQKIMDDFFKACLYGKPTSAHLALRDIVIKKNWGLLTENLDLLHQRTGINPLHHNGTDWLKSSVQEADLQKIDYVISVGLAKDESGFLGWYKALNPKGTIVAINLYQPEYLDNDDIFIQGEIQTLVPLFAKLLI